jgi:hypothetical protein
MSGKSRSVRRSIHLLRRVIGRLRVPVARRAEVRRVEVLRAEAVFTDLRAEAFRAERRRSALVRPVLG